MRPRPALHPRSVAVACGLAAALASPLPANAVAALTASNMPTAGFTAHNVNAATGEAYLRLPPFLDLGGPLPIDFSLYYASLLTGDSQVTGHVGANWLTAYDCALRVAADSATFVGPWGRVARFAKSGGVWTLASPAAWACRLAQTSGGFEVAEPEQRLVYAFAGSGGPLVQIRDAHGNALALGYSTSGWLAQVSDGIGRVVTFTYDTSGHVIDASDGTRHIGLQYAEDRLMAVTDAAGGVTSFAYDGGATAARLTAMVRPRGNTPWTIAYGADGRVASVADAFGNATTYTYAGFSTAVTDPAGHSRVYLHDASGALLSLTDETAATTTYAYDTAGRRIRITDRLGNATRATYDATAGDIASITFPDNSTVSLTYANLPTAAGVSFTYLQDMTYPNGATAHATYDGAGNKTQWIAEDGGVTTWTYNTHGRATSVTNALGGTTFASYNTDETLAALGGANGVGRVYTYDALRRCTGGVWPTGTGIVSVYDDRSLLRSFTDENGATTTYDYDANGLVTRVTTPLGHAWLYAYDVADRPISVTDPLGHTSTTLYDARGLVVAMTDAGGHTRTYDYDARGWLAGGHDPAAAAWTLARNAEGWITQATDPLGGMRSWTHDARGRATSATSPTGAVATRIYDASGGLVRATDPLGGTLARGMDERGCTAGDTLGDGSVETFARNAIGEIVAVTDRNGQMWTRSFGTDGRALTATDPLGHAWSNAYDVRGRLAVATMPAGSATYAWDEAVNRPTSIAFDTGLTLHYDYDADRRLVSSDGWAGGYDAAGRLTSCNGIAAARNADGSIAALTYAPGRQITYGYDARGLVTSVQDWAGGVTTLAYDAAGALTHIVRPNDETMTLARDAAGAETRRVEIGSPGDTLYDLALMRDGLGRVVHATRRGTLDPPRRDTTRVHTVDAASQIADAGWSHDDLGRVLHDDARSYAWDRASRLVSCTDGGSVTEWTHDGLGRPLTASAAGAVESFTWNDLTERPTLAARTRNGALRYFVWTPSGLLLYSIDDDTGARLYYHFDERGNTVALTNAARAVVTRYGYTPFGLAAASGDSLDNPFTFGGESGALALNAGRLYWIGGRAYDGGSGRFLSRSDASPASAVRASRSAARSYATRTLEALLAGPPAIPGQEPGPRATSLHKRPLVLEPNPYVAPGGNPVADGSVAPLDAWPAPQPPAVATEFEGEVTLAVYASHRPAPSTALGIAGVELPPNAPPSGPDLRPSMSSANLPPVELFPEPAFDLNGGGDGGGSTIPRSTGDEPGTLRGPPPRLLPSGSMPFPSVGVLVEPDD